MDHRDFVKQAFNTWAQRPVRGTVLDVGCRDDCMKEYLESKGFSWTGLDPHPAHEGIIGDHMELMRSVPSGSCDLVFLCHSFEHCEHPVSALRECLRVLKDGGWVFIAGPPPVPSQVTTGDFDHIFCLNELQLHKLLVYAGFLDARSWCYLGDCERNNTIVGVGRR